MGYIMTTLNVFETEQQAVDALTIDNALYMLEEGVKDDGITNRWSFVCEAVEGRWTYEVYPESSELYDTMLYVYGILLKDLEEV